jgi:membrane protein DedA with SNARE-associated domain
VLESLIEKYGYLAILLGTFFEGETILVLGGFAAHRGYLLLFGVILAAFCGSLMGDQLFFFLGRKNSRALLDRRPLWKARADRVYRLLERYGTVLIVFFRFLYGLRTITPFIIGASRFPTGKFVLLNAIGALIWAVTVGWGGYIFGQALTIMIGDVKRYEAAVFAVLLLGGMLVWAVHFYRRKKNRSDIPAAGINRH